jgi:flagellar biosynthesis/type III secretory pathway M-ring protein FliF/YscJ
MNDALDGLVRAAAEPMPTPSMTVDPTLVTPGPWGFAIIVFVALAVILLVFDMLRRIRRGRVRADIAEELEAEAQRQAEAAEAATETDDEDVDAGGDDTTSDTRS